jgi:sulfopyruvate decarboxylase subunit beta
MRRLDCVDAFAAVRDDAIVVVGPGFAGHELASAEHRDLTLYNMDMGYAVPLCLGLALACPDQEVVAIEGDGSLLMGLASLTTVARYAPPNLTVIVFDNGYYLTTGSGDVATATTTGGQKADLGALGVAAGIERVEVVAELADFRSAAARALGTLGPCLIVARVDTSDASEPRARGSFPTDLVEQAVLFQVALRARRISRRPL